MKCAIIPQGKQYPRCCSRRLSLEIKTNHLPVMLTSSFMVSFLQDISPHPLSMTGECRDVHSTQAIPDTHSIPTMSSVSPEQLRAL